MTSQSPVLLCELIALIAALGMLVSRQMFHTVLLFLTAMLAVAGIYLLLGATYLFIVQIAIYGGGLSVLMLFAVMITGRQNTSPAPLKLRLSGLIPPVALLAFLMLQPYPEKAPLIPTPDDTKQAGEWISGSFSLPFAVSAWLLIVALVGAVVVVIQKPEDHVG